MPSPLPNSPSRPRPVARPLLLPALLLSLASSVLADAPHPQATVRTLDGATYQGPVAFTNQGIVLLPPADPPRTLALEDLFTLSLQPLNPHHPPSDPSPTPSAPVPLSPPIADWNTLALGVGASGEMESDHSSWMISGGGAGLRGNADALFFAHQPLAISGQLMARIDRFDAPHPESMAGIMLRDNLGESAAYTFLGFRPGSGVAFQFRQIAGGMTMRTTNTVVPLPLWVRLSRVGGAMVGEISTDGSRWDPFGRVNVNLGQNVRAGLAVTSGDPNARAVAVFSQPFLGARGMAYASPSGYPRLTFRGGSTLIAPIESADDAIVRLGGTRAGTLISALNLARIEFAPTPTNRLQSLDPHRSGLLLADGDFIEGQLRLAATNQITINSLLFGYRRFALGSEAIALWCHPEVPDDAPYQVTLQDGSQLRARRIEMKPDAWRLESPLLGALSFPTSEIRQFQRSDPQR